MGDQYKKNYTCKNINKKERKKRNHGKTTTYNCVSE